MNNALGRASFFIEGTAGNNTKGVVVTQDDSTYVSYKTMIGGHDLKGPDLLRFHKQVLKDCAASNNDANICYNSYEKDMIENFVIPYSQKMPGFVVISFASQSSMDWRDVVTHEVMHAQYFNQPMFQKIVDEFWTKDVTEMDREAIRFRLSQNYDSSDEFLMKNEFQAYILMAGAIYSQLGGFVGKYREPLMKRLEANQIYPIQVQ